MPQLYPQPVSSTIGVTVNAGAGLVGGGNVELGQAITIAAEAQRIAYTTDPAADGLIGTFNIQGPVPSGQIDVYNDGNLQTLDAYTIQGNQILFQTPPVAGTLTYAVYAQPSDSRQQFTLDFVGGTTYTFPAALPAAGYVDIYDSTGLLLTANLDYTLNRIAGIWSVVFTAPPAAAPLACFPVNGQSFRNQYSLSPVPDGATTQFRIVGGVPDNDSVDVFSSGSYQGADATTLDLSAGEWVVDFTSAPAIGQNLQVVF